MKRDARLRRLLELAGGLPHGDRTLRDHLLGTWSILHAWGAPSSVARTGLIHSVYSTQYYRLALVSKTERAKVQRAAGARAEALAHAFCTLDRWELWQTLAATRSATRVLRQGDLAVSDPRVIYALLWVEMANIAEQSRGPSSLPAPWMHWVLGWRGLRFPKGLRPPVLQLRGRLTERDEADACRAYASWFGRGSHHPSGLREVLRHNPFASEPHLLLAATLASEGNLPPARRHLQQALRLLSVWQTSWDKRLPMATWVSLARDLRRALSRRDPSAQRRSAATLLATACEGSHPRRA